MPNKVLRPESCATRAVTPATGCKLTPRIRVSMFYLVYFFALGFLSLLVIMTTSEARALKTGDKATGTDKADGLLDSAPQPGDTKVVDGVEYIYGSNKRYMFTPQEPQYIWVRKDQYSPRLGENLFSGGASKKENDELEKRIAKLENDLGKKDTTPQATYPAQGVYSPSSLPENTVPPEYTVTSLKVRKRVIVLPLVDKTDCREEQLGDLSTRRLVSMLENMNAVVSVDPDTLNLTGEVTEPGNMALLNEVYGVQVLVKGVLSRSGSGASPPAFTVGLILYDTETGAVMKRFSGRGSLSAPEGNTDHDLWATRIKAIDAALKPIAEDIARTVATLDWHARIASIENQKVYVNAGKLSGLEKGVASRFTPREGWLLIQGRKPLWVG